ncbi:hypothetical protein EDD11_001628 [Mortierella claussenii]|nr:hypothetical protein EDD11_001628 [Mortierella claussenii]
MSARLEKTQAIVQHILRHIPLPRRCPLGVEHAASKPLIVGLSGPQGIGKTTITNKLISTLSNAPHNLRVFAFSTDDLYLPFKEQTALSNKYPDNKLIEFRGLPGTHDIQLGASTFHTICEANEEMYTHSDLATSVSVPIPTYDKALHSGRGDQAPRAQWPQADAPFDVILFEGWSLGFKSIRDSQKLLKVYEQHSTFPPFYLGRHSFSSVELVDQFLEAYESEWYNYLDVFVHLSSPNLETIFKWRAEQERDLWAKKGSGMSEEQVREFVSRFMPAYELYLERLKRENLFKDDKDLDSTSGQYEGRHLRLNLDENRDLVSMELVN